MIYTVTFNPAIDYYITLDQSLADGKILKTANTKYAAGGKGVNISTCLSNAHIDSIAVIFLGGFVGKYIKDTVSEIPHIEVVEIPIQENNRVNVKFSGKSEMAVNAAGPLVSEDEINDLLIKMSNVSSNDIVVISGSYCRGVDHSVVEKIADIVRQAEGKLILDVPNMKFDDLAKVKPFLIKPNVEELASIFGQDINDDNYHPYVDRLVEAGVENVVLSIGAPGSYFANNENKMRVTGPSIEVVSTVGCGDSMLAFIIAALHQGKTIEEAVRYGEAAGRVKAGSFDLPTIEKVEAMLPSINIEK